jgi:hypothetical protein
MEEEVKLEEKEVVKPIKKKGGCLKSLLSLILFLIFIVLLLAFFLPGLIWPRTLGVSYTKEDYDSFMSKLGYIKDEAPDLSSEYEYNYGPVKNVDIILTSEEITAFFNTNRPSDYAIKKVEVRVNPDGTIEAVASANVDYFLKEFFEGEIGREDIKNEMPALGFLPSSVNLYLNIEGEIINNKSTVSVNSASVQGIPIPSGYINDDKAVSFVTDGINKLISNHSQKSGAYFERIAVVDGNLVLKGKIPSTLERIKISD